MLLCFFFGASDSPFASPLLRPLQMHLGYKELRELLTKIIEERNKPRPPPAVAPNSYSGGVPSDAYAGVKSEGAAPFPTESSSSRDRERERERERDRGGDRDRERSGRSYDDRDRREGSGRRGYDDDRREASRRYESSRRSTE